VTYAEGPTSGGVGSGHSQRSGGPVGVETVDLTHDEVHDQLSEYLAGTLDEAQATRIRGHLRGCATCAADLQTLKRTIEVLHSLPSHTAPDTLRRRLLAIPDAEPAAEPEPSGG